MRKDPTMEAQTMRTVANPEQTFDWRTLLVVPFIALGGLATVAWLGAIAFGGFRVALLFFG